MWLRTPPSLALQKKKKKKKIDFTHVQVTFECEPTAWYGNKNDQNILVKKGQNADLMVVLQGTQAVLRPLLDFVRLFAESHAEENTPVGELAASVREVQAAQKLQQSVFVQSCLPPK